MRGGAGLPADRSCHAGLAVKTLRAPQTACSASRAKRES
jgi:hypothetical protein